MSGGAMLLAPRRRRERQEFALPMINVIFLLILYFLIAGTIVEKDELTFAPPETIEVPDTRLPRPLLVLAPDGSVRLDGVVLGDDWVSAAKMAVGAEGRQINILAPATYPAADLMQRIAALGRAAVPVRLVTVRREAGP